jgi:uncharacterized membrane protein YfcA
MLLPCVPLGYWIGRYLLKKLSQANLGRIISIPLLMTGLKLLWDAFA